MRVLIVGSGDVAEIHLRTLPTIEDIEISGFVDVIQHRAAQLANRYQSTAFTDMRVALDKAKPDCVFLFTPRTVREKAIQLCLNRETPVFIEKPPCDSLATGKRILDKLKASGLIHSVGFRHRYNEPLNHFLGLSKEESLSAVSILLRSPLALEGLWKTKPYAYQYELSGGIIGEVGIHYLDLARYICQCEVREFRVLGSNKSLPAEGNAMTRDVVGWTLEMENGSIVTTLITWLGRSWGCTVDLVTTNSFATVELLPNRRDLTARGESSGKPLEYVAREYELKCEQRAFITAVQQRDMSPIRSTYEDSLRSFELSARLNKMLYGRTSELN